MRRLPLLLSIAAIIGVVVLFYRSTTVKQANVPVVAGSHVEEEESEPIEVAVYMGRIQRFHQKWWLAGKAGNGPLAKFYLHEMEEAMEEIADAGVKDDGVDVSAEMKVYGLPAVGNLQKLLEKEGVAAMHAGAGGLANSCNGCHMATRHPYIRIKEPAEAAFPDQDFAPM